MSRTLKQQWQFERCWKNFGGVSSTIERLKRIAFDDSTLVSEQMHITNAIITLTKVLNDWRNKDELSYEVFENRRKR